MYVKNDLLSLDNNRTKGDREVIVFKEDRSGLFP